MSASWEQHSVDAFASAGVLCAEQDVLPDAFDELAERLQLGGFDTVSYEVAGLAERIRAGLNGTKVPHPVKPYNPPPKPAPKPAPKPPPPPKQPPQKPGR